MFRLGDGTKVVCDQVRVGLLGLVLEDRVTSNE